MEFQLDQGWKMQPVKGATGKTYLGVKEEERVFIKRNTTPMLAALSREGMTPKLLWTKRTGSGDVLTAQEWLEGLELSPEEIGCRNDVIDVLYHLHHSPTLKAMLQRIGGRTMTPELFLNEFQEGLPELFQQQTFLRSVVQYLTGQLPPVSQKHITVVHGDVNHRNWLVSRNYLYLVDWDSIMFADRSLDIGTILGHYVPLSKWPQWLMAYGIQATDENLAKIHWYSTLSVAKEAKRMLLQGDRQRAKEEILQLKRFFSV